MSKTNKILQDIIHLINSEELTESEILELVYTFTYSIGASLDGSNNESPENILKKYAEKKTLGSALMAQALWMKDTWNK